MMAIIAPDNLLRKLDELAEQYEALTVQLGDADVLADHRRMRAVSIKHKALQGIVEPYRRWLTLRTQIDELDAIVHGGGDMEHPDRELVDLAREEIPELQAQSAALLDEIQQKLVTADDASVGSIIVEMRAGVGGDEAALWAGDLALMYERYAAQRGWQFEHMQLSPGEMGGFKQAIVRIEGEGVWSQLGYEGGTHQVKRVPATEAQGRIHTSTATVAVLPEPEEVELDFDRNDVREMITTAQGPGGQNVNKVATAVHLIHEPTGIEVRMQDTKSQVQNRERAWALLRARLHERQRAEAAAARSEQRSAMIGSASRAEKIRTYRYKENIAVDHRLPSGGNSFNLTELLGGNMQPLIDGLIAQDTAQRLAAL